MKINNKILNIEIDLELILERNKIKIKLEDIIEIYQGKNRFYHNFSHIKDMLKNIKIYNEELIISILFHDIVYDVNSNKNEEKSVEYFEKYYFGKNKEYLERVKNMIIVTENKVEAKNYLEEEMLRVDRKILFSKDINKLILWEKGISKEYQSYSIEQYINGRVEFLENAMKETGNKFLGELIEIVKKKSLIEK